MQVSSWFATSKIWSVECHYHQNFYNWIQITFFIGTVALHCSHSILFLSNRLPTGGHVCFFFPFFHSLELLSLSKQPFLLFFPPVQLFCLSISNILRHSHHQTQTNFSFSLTSSFLRFLANNKKYSYVC